MRYQAVMMLFSGAIGLCLSGCSATSPLMRGQSPNAQSVSWGAPCAENGGACDTGTSRRAARRNGGCESCNCQNGGACDSGMCQNGNCESGACQNGRCGRGGFGPDRCLNLPCHPVHRNFHTYDAPSGLTYPQQDTPPATYQYPYYTTRGPTDFFMK